MKNAKSHDVRQFQVGDERHLRKTAGGGREWQGMAGNGRGQTEYLVEKTGFFLLFLNDSLGHNH